MGRAEAPLQRDGTAAVELAYWLRELRREAGLTYSEIAQHTNYAASSLQGACSGRRFPSEKITMAIVATCAGDLPAWADYWARLRRMTTEVHEADLRPPWLPATPEPADTATSPAEAAPPVDDHPPGGGPAPSSSRQRPSPARRRLAWLTGVAASFTFGVLLGHRLPHDPAPAPRDTAAQPAAHGLIWEREANRDGAPSVTDPRQPAVPGPRVPFGRPVQVTCEMRVTNGGSEMGWYLVASQPWTDRFYAPVADFATLATGAAVPSC